MKLSDLQKYILKQTYVQGPQCSRSFFGTFYKKMTEQNYKIITVSMERLIAKGLLKGFGYKTAEKFFIQKVSLTPLGKKQTIQLFGNQQSFLFKKKKYRSLY